MFLATLVLTTGIALSGDDKKPVELVHSWSVGTRYHIEFTKTREDVESGKPVVATDVQIGGALVDRISALVDGLKMDLITDASGSVMRLADPLAMETHFESATKALVAELEAARSLTPGDLTALRTAAASLKGPSFQASYLRFPIAFYMPSGSSLVLGEKRAYEDHLPNPFGGEPLPSQAWLELRAVRAEANEAIVEWRQTIDPMRAGPVLEASIRAFAQRTGQELPVGAALAFDAIEDASTYVYDLSTGVPKSLAATRTTSMAGMRRIDTQRFDVTWLKTK